MNKLTKKLLALGLALSIVVGVGSVSVFASSSSGPAQGFCDVHRIYCFSELGQKTARAKTTVFYNGGMTRISSDYTYMNNSTLKKTTVTKENRAIQTTGVSFTAPGNSRSVRIASTHKVEFNSQWTGHTYVNY